MFDYSTVDLDAILARAYEQMSPFQRQGVGKARKHGRTLFNVWMGVGKTFMGLTAGLCFKPQTWLIIGSKNTLNGWRQEVKKWFPEFGSDDLYTIVRGNAYERQELYQRPSLFYSTTAGAFRQDIKWLLTKKVRFDVITLDEPQKFGLRNRQSQGFAAIKDLVQHIEGKNRHPISLINPMTGTWTSKGSSQMWPTLNLLAPKEFRGYWRFVETFNVVINGNFGREIIAPQNTMGLAQVTMPYVYTVDEAMAKSELPPIRRIPLTTEMPPNLAKVYLSLAEHLFYEMDDRVESVSTILGAYTKLRQLICCPSTVEPSLGVGPAIEIVCDKILDHDELPNWKHNIVFSPFLPALPLFKSYLAEKLDMPLSKILMLQGGAEPEDVQLVEHRFRNEPDTMVLCSLMYAQSFNLETTLNVYFPHFSWDQDDNKQAEARARRKDGKQAYIGSYYVNILGSITQDMFDILNRKEGLNKVTYQDVAKLKAKLQAQIERKAI